MNKITFLVGDDAGEGHAMTERVEVETNFNATKLIKAYKKGAKKLNYDFEVKAASVHNKKKLPKSVFDVLIDSGYVATKRFAKTRELDVDTYVDIWCFIAKLGDSKLRFRTPSDEEPNELPIGGYALFGGDGDE